MKKMKLILGVLASLAIIIAFILLGINYFISGNVRNIRHFGTNEKIFLEKTFEIYLPEGTTIKNIATIHGKDKNLYAKVEVPRNKLKDFNSKIGFNYNETSKETSMVSYYKNSLLKWWRIDDKSVTKVIEADKKFIVFIYTSKNNGDFEIFMFLGNVHLNTQDEKLFR